MPNTEYDHCKNCLFFNGFDKCKHHDKDVDKRCWCGDHVRKNPLDANDIAVENDIRNRHMLCEMKGVKTHPIEEVLKKFGWDGTERLKQGKFPEDKECKDGIQEESN